jgi:hypothetical protein
VLSVIFADGATVTMASYLLAGFTVTVEALDVFTTAVIAIFYLVTEGNIVAIPSITLDFTLVGLVINKSYTYLPGVKFAVFAALIAIVSSPLAALETVTVKLFAVVE